MDTPSHQPAIIMIHGFRGTHHGLALIARSLGEFHTIVPDVPGFGEAQPLTSHDLDSYVHWLHQFITGQNFDQPPSLLGHSFGSIITAAYAAKYSQTISKLILVNPISAPALQGPKAIITQLAVFYYWVGRKLPSGLAHRWLSAKSVVMIMSMTMAKTRDPDLRKFIHNQHKTYFSRFSSAKMLSEAFLTSIGHTVGDFAADIPMPTLLIAGDKDDITPVEKQQAVVKLFPHATLEIIKNVGHLTHYETPDTVAEFIRSFCQSDLNK